MRFPSVRRLMEDVSTENIHQSINYLMGQKLFLRRFTDYWDFVLCEEPHIHKIVEACGHHLGNIRMKMAKLLWSHEYYIGVSVIDSLLFSAMRRSSTDNPIQWVFEKIRDLGLHRPGFILYPLHSFGIQGAGPLITWTESRLRLVLDNYGLIITPQTNSFDKTLDFIDTAAETLGIAQRAPRDLLEHWRRSRSTEWLERNPLMFLRIHSSPGDYYENQYFIISKLRFARSLVFLLSTLQPPQDEHRPRYLLSTSRINNSQTLDIYHYFIFYPKPHHNHTLGGDCVPMSVHGSTLAELSELNVELNPLYWKRRTIIVNRFCNALKTLENEYLASLFQGEKNRLKARVARKLFNSLLFFRRSFRQSGDSIDAVVNLACAFEILLTDNYSPGIKDEIHHRLNLALYDVKEKKTMLKNTEGLYDARSAYVHTGEADKWDKFHGARAAFAQAFLAIIERMDRLPKVSSEPIGEILRDCREH